MRALSTILCIIAIAGLALACQRDVRSKVSEKHEIRLNQSLLRESTVLLSQLWDTKVELDPDVSVIPNLSVNYEPVNAVSLAEALEGILIYVAREHRVRLKWAVRGDRILISK